MVFFIAAMIIAASLVGAFYLVVDNLNDAMVARSEAEQRSIRSRVEIINDLVAMPYNNTSKELIVYVKNTGAERLDPNQTIVFIDGLHHNYTWRLIGGVGNWTPGETLELTVKDCYFSAFSDHSVKVNCANGASDRKEFSIKSLP
jgi:flagellar protein FlaG